MVLPGRGAACLTEMMTGINTAIRGTDIAPLVAATQAVAERLGLASPRTPLIGVVRDADGAKLSKSAGAEGVLCLRERGIAAEQVLNNVYRSLHPHTAGRRQLSLSEMIGGFTLGHVVTDDVMM